MEAGWRPDLCTDLGAVIFIVAEPCINRLLRHFVLHSRVESMRGRSPSSLEPWRTSSLEPPRTSSLELRLACD
jgi:hypothetical protein